MSLVSVFNVVSFVDEATEPSTTSNYYVTAEGDSVLLPCTGW